MPCNEARHKVAQRIEDVAHNMGARRAGNCWRAHCPACGYAEPTLIIKGRNRKSIAAYCVNCDGKERIAEALALAGVSNSIRGNDEEKSPEKIDEARRRRLARATSIWSGADRLRPDDPATRYLRSRGLGDAINLDAFRYRRDTPHPSGVKCPALLARIDDAGGEMAGLHRTFLTLDGKKANLDPVKASIGQIWGNACRLGQPPTDAKDIEQTLVVAEGIETALSAGRIMGHSAWAAISAGNLERAMVLPSWATTIIIAADPDSPGLRAAEGALQRWRAKNRVVRIFKPTVAGLDFNDMLVRALTGVT